MKIPRLSIRSIALFLAFCLLPSLVAAQAPHFDSMFVFGDSLADNGNVLKQSQLLRDDPPVPPTGTYFEGRFSNGYVGVEFLWQSLSGHAPGTSREMKPFLEAPMFRGAGAIDFAFGGTGTPLLDQTPGGMWAPGLKGQVELFKLAMRGKKPAGRSLYVIATGANDYRDDPFNVPMDPADVARNIEESIESLYKFGARDVMVLDLPDLGLIPANLLHPDPQVGAAATETSLRHNEALDAALSRVRARYPRLHLIPITLDVPFNQLRGMLSPAKWPFPALDLILNGSFAGSSPCLFFAPQLCPDVPVSEFNVSNGFLFWDIVHPTTQAHRHLGQYLFEALSKSYE